MTYSIIVPCYNEEMNVDNLVKSLEQSVGGRNVEFILVENGSQDTTRNRLRETCHNKENFKMVFVDKNLGYGYGLICGMKAASGDYIGWIHADMQVSPKTIMQFIDYAEMKGEMKKLFLKGIRKNRRPIDCVFTAGMTIFATLVLKQYLYDIGAIPVLFHRSLLKSLDKTPYDFSIETYVYYKAIQTGMDIKRFKVTMENRKRGASSWNKGFASKLRQSKIIALDIIQIKYGKKVR